MATELELRRKSKEQLVLEVIKLREALDKSYNQLHILSRGNADLLTDSLQNLYSAIANLAVNSLNLEQLYYDIHAILKKHIDVNNFIIAINDEKQEFIHFPYYVDEHFGGVVQSIRRKISKGLTEYNLMRSEPLFLYEEEIIRLVEEGTLVITGKIPKIWMGVPLKIDEKIIGLIGVKSYNHKNKYNLKHLQTLDFISGQIALAIERKRNEEKLNFQNARIKAIFESSSHLIWSVNKKLALTSFNHNYANFIKNIYGKSPFLNEIPQSLNKILKSNEQITLLIEKYQKAFEGKPQHFEINNQIHDGHQMWLEIFLNPIALSDGSVEEVSGIAHDITNKKLAEISMQESEEKFRHIFESFQDIYYRTDLVGKVIMISPSVYELTGYRQEEVLGRKIDEFYENSYSNMAFEKDLYINGIVKNFEANFITKNGKIIPTISNVNLIFNKNKKPIAIQGVVRDISGLHEAYVEIKNSKNIAEKSLKVKQLFLANMSHEIRTPMNGIIGMIDLLSASSLNTEQKDYVNTIKKSSQTLLNILNDILDLSKLEAGKMQLKLSPVSVQESIEKLFSLFKTLADSKKIQLEYSIADDVPAYINADATRLLQVLSNLTSNAIKFTDKGSVSVIVKKAGKKRLKFVVQDTGIGIAKEDVRLLFDSFSQLDNSSSKSYAGTGLGLAISKELCKLMGGSIGVKSKKEEGSIFWFTIELNQVHKLELVKSISENDEVSIEKFKNKIPYILLVDDNMINQKVAKEIMLKSGCKVDVAYNGVEAILKIIDNTYDLILMDIQMPEMDGISATKKIKELRIKNLAPIIAMTAYSMEDDKDRFLSAGMDDYLAKPIRLETLIAIIKKWVFKLDEDDITTQNSKIVLTEKIINHEIIAQLRTHIDDETILGVYEEFEEDTQQLINGCITNDWDVIKSNLHTLKGNAGTLGIDKLAKIATYVENNIKKKNTSNFDADFINLKNAFDEFKNVYKNNINVAIHAND
ncbi:MAG: ATP-binding protein [Cytophagales bacterium]|nr:ATP-binding protein [Cytophagales bacterium]